MENEFEPLYPVFDPKNTDKDGWEVVVGSGSQDVLTRAFDVLLEDGDSVMVESPCYPGTLAYLKPRDLDIISLEMDEYGVKPQSIRDALNSKNVRKRPRVLCIIPTGH
eukprot:UN27043